MDYFALSTERQAEDKSRDNVVSSRKKPHRYSRFDCGWSKCDRNDYTTWVEYEKGEVPDENLIRCIG